MVGGCDPEDILALEEKRCCGNKKCDFSHRKHIQLTGADKRGVALTARAQEFPGGMSNQLANMLCGKALLCR